MTLYNTNQDIEEAQARFLSNTSRVPYYPISFKRGEGSKLWDEDGKEYIDFLSSACSANIGYGNKELADAIKEQIDNLLQFTIAYFSNATATKFAEKICEITPGFYEKKVSFTCTGSTAIDAAIKFARAYTGRTKLISFAQAYHGSSYGAISVSALSLEMKKKIGPLLPEVYHFEYPICSKCKFGQKESSCNIECLSQMKYAFNHYIPVEEVAAIFIEPIAGDAGIVIPPKKWAKELRNLCDEKGILLVSDEIQQGIGRTGKWFGIENLDIEADILVLGKAIGGGFPLGAVVARKEIMDVLAPPANIYTMAGNPTVCAAGLKTIEIIEKGNILDNVIIMGDYLKEKFRRLQEKYDIIGEIRGIGLSIGVDIVKDKISKEQEDGYFTEEQEDGYSTEKNPDAATKICYRCIQTGLVMIFLGKSTLRIQPPLVITKEEVDKGMEILENAIIDYLEGRIGDEVYEITQGW